MMYSVASNSAVPDSLHSASSQPKQPEGSSPVTKRRPLGQRTEADFILLSLGESMKRPGVTDSVSDIFELDDSQPMTTVASTANGAGSNGGLGGRPAGALANVNQAQAQHHRHDQYLQHNCNPRHNHNINAMSIETDV